MSTQDAENLEKIQNAYWSLSGDEQYVKVVDVKATTGLTTDEMTAALKHGSRTGSNVRFDPDPFPWRVTQPMKDSAVFIGGEHNHYISMDRSKRPAAEPASRAGGEKDMATGATAQSAAGKKPVVNWPKPSTSEIAGNVSSAAYCNDAAFQFHQAATYAEAMHAAVVNDMTEFLREWGLDGQRSFGPLSYGSDARSAARKAAKPLKNIAAEFENIAKNFALLKRNLDAYVWDPAEQAKAEKERSQRTAPVRLGA